MSEETTFPIYFNVKGVRDYLLKYGHVYTIRKKGRPVGYTRAIQKEGDEIIDLGEVYVYAITRTLNSYEKLLPYVDESGIEFTPDDFAQTLYKAMGYSFEDCRKMCIAQMWLGLAQKLSGNNLGLFKVELAK